MPPSDHLNPPLPQECVISSTTGASVIMSNVHSHINAVPVMATIHTHTATNENSLNANFNPLPNSILTPINVDFLRSCLTNHPDRELVDFLLQGFSQEFDIGYCGPINLGQTRNLLSACNNPVAVKESIQKELLRGHTSGPFDQPPYTVLHCSPIGAIPKKDNTHRIILDLSSPRNRAVDEGISRVDYSVHYSSFDDAVDMVSKFSKGCFLAKLDIKHAFRLCPVRPEDWCLLGHSFNNQYFIDTRLPFGSRSSPFLFNTFANLLTWILIFVYGIPNLIHYLDDFFLCAQTYDECQEYMSVMQCAFDELGVSLLQIKSLVLQIL